MSLPRSLAPLLSFAPLLALAPLLACATPSSIAVNHVSGRIYKTAGSTLWTCDASGETCTQGAVVLVPVDAAVAPDSRVVFVAGNAVYVCNDEGQACIEVKLPEGMKGVGLSVAPSGEIFVITAKGALAACTETGCRKVESKHAK
jgi:DNA-binding beta-propeller fold protein YncE